MYYLSDKLPNLMTNAIITAMKSASVMTPPLVNQFMSAWNR
jgi:hypothetical protein